MDVTKNMLEVTEEKVLRCLGHVNGMLEINRQEESQNENQREHEGKTQRKMDGRCKTKYD